MKDFGFRAAVRPLTMRHIMREDGVLTLHIAGKDGLPWAIGLLIVNQNT